MPSTRSRRSPAFASFTTADDEEGLSDYLVLLSVYQTCKYRGVSFLKFLLSQEEDVEAFCRAEAEEEMYATASRSTRRASPG